MSGFIRSQPCENGAPAPCGPGGVPPSAGFRATKSADALDRFPTTQWSEVARAADVDPQVKRAAMGRLLRQYLPAFRAHLLRHKHVSADRVDDLLQGFACDQVVAEDLIAGADHRRGRLRTFLLVALDRHIAGVRRFENAKKRCPSGGCGPVSLDDAQVSPAVPADETCGEDVTSAFDAAWASQVLARTTEAMREQCARGCQQRVWELFDARVLAPAIEGAEPPRYEQLVQRLGFESPLQASNALVTAKRMFVRTLRAVIAEYADDEAEIDAELDDLWRALAKASPRRHAAR